MTLSQPLSKKKILNKFFLTSFEKYLPDLFKHMNIVWTSIDGRMKSESFKVNHPFIERFGITEKIIIFIIEKSFKLY
jgi:hypothetical protein